MIGPHVQQGVPNWLDSMAQFPRQAVTVAVNDYFLLRDVKAANFGAFTVFRKWWDDRPQWGGDYQTEKQRARDYFDAFIDGTWLENGIWQYVDAVKELNEYNASSNSEAERQLILVHLQAWCDTWNTEYRGKPKVGGRDIPLVCLSTPTGNDIDHRYARVISQTDNVISYHGYTYVRNGQIGGGLNSEAVLDDLAGRTRRLSTGQVVPFLMGSDLRTLRQHAQMVKPQTAEKTAVDNENLEWNYFSGRWSVMDADFRARGIRVRWISTEGGPFAGVLEGWRHPGVYNGDLQKYANEFVPYQMGRIRAWNQANGNRFIGSTLFTVAPRAGTWIHYTHDAAELDTLGRAINNYAGNPPPPPPPPPVDPLATAVWQYGQANGLCTANNDAALNAAIWRDNWDVGGAETWAMVNGVNVAIQAATSRRNPGRLRYYYTEVGNWGNVRYVEGLNE